MITELRYPARSPADNSRNREQLEKYVIERLIALSKNTSEPTLALEATRHLAAIAGVGIYPAY